MRGGGAAPLAARPAVPLTAPAASPGEHGGAHPPGSAWDGAGCALGRQRGLW